MVGQRATFLGFSAAGGQRLVEKMESAKELVDVELAERFRRHAERDPA